MDMRNGDVVLVKTRHPEFPRRLAVVKRVEPFGVIASIEVELRWADVIPLGRQCREPEAAE